MAAKRDKSYIKRKIYFYRIHAGINLAGKPIDYDIQSALGAIEKLDFQSEARYLKDEDDEICCWINSSTPPQKVIFGRINRNDFPQLERRGVLSDLSVPEESGLAECVHVMFFPDNIVGVECNYDGPRVTRISDYLHVKSQNVCSQVPVFQELLQPDVIERLGQWVIVKRFSLKVRDSLFSSSAQADEYLAQTFESARKLGQPKTIELVLSVGKGGGTLGTRILTVAKNLLLLRETSKDVISGQIKGTNDTGKIEVIDLLKAKYVTEKRIPKDTTLSSEQRSELFFSAINEAYEDLKDQLKTAVGVTLCPV